jgi:CRP-like cAMP-binding protein
MAVTAKHVSIENRLLKSLPEDQLARLSPHMEMMRLPQSRTLYEAGATVNNLYFPNDGMISLLSMNGDGTTIEVGMVGNEGVVGLPIVLRINTTPYGAMVQLPSEVIKIRGEIVKAEFERPGPFNHLLLRYTHVLLTQISQSVVCNRFHTIEKRLCRWLLVARDRVKHDTLHLTQEIIAHMLGISRTGVTTAAGALQKAGFIRYSRGRIVLIDRKAMEAFSCECYQITKEEFERFGDN